MMEHFSSIICIISSNDLAILNRELTSGRHLLRNVFRSSNDGKAASIRGAILCISSPKLSLALSNSACTVGGRSISTVPPNNNKHIRVTVYLI